MGDQDTIRALLERPLQVVAGKGGVGRSALSTAIALRAARAGRRTLLLEVHSSDNCARMLGVEPAPDEPREVLNRLWLCRMTPQGSLREYALLILKFRALYNFVFENPLVKYFLRSVPSLGEFTMAGKAWFHSVEKLPSEQPRYDCIVLDAPATGHAITFLSVSRVVADTVPKGIMKNAAENMAGWFEDRERSCLHVVATPEEMPVNEALELVQAARGRLRMTPGLAILNRVLPPMFDQRDEAALDALDGLAAPSLAPFLSAARQRRAWQGWQAECRERLGRASGLPRLDVPELGVVTIDREAIDRIVGALDAAAGTGGGRD